MQTESHLVPWSRWRQLHAPPESSLRALHFARPDLSHCSCQSLQVAARHHTACWATSSWLQHGKAMEVSVAARPLSGSKGVEQSELLAIQLLAQSPQSFSSVVSPCKKWRHENAQSCALCLQQNYIEGWQDPGQGHESLLQAANLSQEVSTRGFPCKGICKASARKSHSCHLDWRISAQIWRHKGGSDFESMGASRRFGKPSSCALGHLSAAEARGQGQSFAPHPHCGDSLASWSVTRDSAPARPEIGSVPSQFCERKINKQVDQELISETAGFSRSGFGSCQQKWVTVRLTEAAWRAPLPIFAKSGNELEPEAQHTIKTGSVRFSRLARGSPSNVTIKETSTNFLPKALCLRRNLGNMPWLFGPLVPSLAWKLFLLTVSKSPTAERSEVELFLVLRILRVILSCGWETHKN